jgi:hypothetical protein
LSSGADPVSSSHSKSEAVATAVSPLPLSSHQFIRHPLNVPHVVVHNRLNVTVVPFDGDTRPICFSDNALISYRRFPTNALADAEGS